jgi:MoaA/NifB/PqqE/SkfB family radical SAM enzyme
VSNAPSTPGAGFAAVKRRALEAAIPLSVHLELTYDCDCHCVFCYNPPRRGQQPLSLGEWRGVLDDLRLLGTLNVTLTGGEPLAHPEFFAIAAAARERAFALRILTTGFRVTEETARRLAELRLLSVEMSLHGATATTHDRTTRRPGSFAALRSAVDRLRARDVPVVLKMILTRLNEAELDAAIALAEGVPLRIDPTLTPCDDGDLSPLDFAASPAALERLMAHLSSVGRVPVAERSPGGYNCGLGRLALAIDPFGSVFPCIQWRTTSLGNVRSARLVALWKDSPVRQEAAAIALAVNDRLLEIVGAAAHFPFCPALARQVTGDPLTPDADFLARADVAARARGGPDSGDPRT